MSGIKTVYHLLVTNHSVSRSSAMLAKSFSEPERVSAFYPQHLPVSHHHSLRRMLQFLRHSEPLEDIGLTLQINVSISSRMRVCYVRLSIANKHTRRQKMSFDLITTYRPVAHNHAAPSKQISIQSNKPSQR
jgi:hypothetical protein